MYSEYRPKTQGLDFSGLRSSGGVNEAAAATAAQYVEAGGGDEFAAAAVRASAAGVFVASNTARNINLTSHFQKTLRPTAPDDAVKAQAWLPHMSTKPDIIAHTLPTNFGSSTRKLRSTAHSDFTLPQFAEQLRTYRESSLHNLKLSADVTRSNNPHGHGAMRSVQMSNGQVLNVMRY